MRFVKNTSPATLFSLVVLAGAASVFAAQLSIEEVMEKYHKGKTPLCKKVSSGQATKEELKTMLAGYQAMAAQKPPKGDDASWKSKTAALVTATQSMIDGKPEGLAKYKEAINCKACHSVHKGK